MSVEVTDGHLALSGERKREKEEKKDNVYRSEREKWESIIEEILRGMKGGRKAERHVVADRRDAIAKAFEMAGPGDAVVIAGKGHAPYQQLRDRTVPFDDRQVARDLLARLARSGRA